MRTPDPRYNEIDWTLGACRGVERNVFFDPECENEAQQICNGCVIELECRHYALMANEEFGVWGGLTAAQRRNMKSKRVRVRCPGCGSTEVDKSQHRVEICASCGLSYPV